MPLTPGMSIVRTMKGITIWQESQNLPVFPHMIPMAAKITPDRPTVGCKTCIGKKLAKTAAKKLAQRHIRLRNDHRTTRLAARWNMLAWQNEYVR